MDPSRLQPGPIGHSPAARLAYSLRMRATRWALPRLGWLGRLGARLTVRDLFSTPGDTLLTAILCHHLQRRYPGLSLNVVTRNPALLRLDPAIAELNGPLGPFVFDFWYLELSDRKDKTTHVLAPSLATLRAGPLDYRARVYLSAEERAAARARLAGWPRPLISLNTLSAQPAKNWPLASWRAVLPALARRGTLVQLGDAREPDLPGARRLAGALDLRESIAVLAECALHLGPDSFLMHAANGVGVPSVIIYGGSRAPANLGYAANRNLFADVPCSGCWLTGWPGDECPYELKCLAAITPEAVLAAAEELLAARASPTPLPAA